MKHEKRHNTNTTHGYTHVHKHGGHHIHLRDRHKHYKIFGRLSHKISLHLVKISIKMTSGVKNFKEDRQMLIEHAPEPSGFNSFKNRIP